MYIVQYTENNVEVCTCTYIVHYNVNCTITLYIVYLLCVHCIFTLCTLYIYSMYIEHLLYVHCTFTLCTLYNYFMYNVQLLYVQCTFTLCTIIHLLYIHCTFTLYTLYIYFYNVQCISTLCKLY